VSNRFDAEAHVYSIDGHPVPSVTKIIKAIMGQQHFATDWHLERGRVVHQCAAMLCAGIRFTHDPQIDGYIQSIKAWLEIRKPRIIAIEQRMFSAYFGYAGTCDLICQIENRMMIIDWKASPSPVDQWQLAAYSHLANQDGILCNQGMIVELSNDGKPREGKVIELRQARNEWQSILNVYKMKEREGLFQ
jgi:hypothetical protein